LHSAEGVHHYDEWGYSFDMAAEPPEIQKIHKEMIHFVLEWLREWPRIKAERMRAVRID
jgi:hypothetical protein